MSLNPEEYFDVVDENDQVIDRMARSEVHRRKLLHRAVHVFVFRSDGCMLIHKRADSKEEFPSVWTSSCSGHVTSGEDYDATAVRELFEELGVESAVDRLRKFAACDATSREFTVLYCCCSDASLTPDPEEITCIRWMLIDEIDDWITRSPDDFSPAFRLLFAWFMEQRRIQEIR